VQRLLVVIALVAGVVTTAPAQSFWHTEFGIQGGFARLVPAGTATDPTDAVSLPGFNLGNILPSTAGLFVIIPWSNKFAVETDVAASQLNLPGGTATFFGAGLRGNYAVMKHFYVAAGGALAYNNGVANEAQVGVQGALGYRFALGRTANARVEGSTTFYGKADNAGPADVYAVSVGISTVTSHGRGTGMHAAAPSATHPTWRWQIGIAGGYADVHLIGLGSVTSLSFPGYGGGVGNALAGMATVLHAVTLPPTMFAIIPVGSRMAIEPGLDMHRFQTGGQTDFSGNLSARFDYAVHGAWYGALGGNLHYIKSSGLNGTTRTGVNVAWGYRFPLVLGVGGRLEANYTWFGENTDLGLPPTNVFGLMFGAAMPLK
jgi:hypothetical protein